MARTNDVTDGADTAVSARADSRGACDARRPSVRPNRVPKLGIWAWCFVGVVSGDDHRVHRTGRGERDRLADDVRRRAGHRLQAAGPGPRAPWVEAEPGGRAHRPRPHRPDGGVVVATVRGVTDQADQIGSVTDQAIEKAAEHLDAAGIDQAALEDARASTEGAAPMISDGPPHQGGRRHRHGDRYRQRRDPRRADHVLPAQGRQQASGGPSSQPSTPTSAPTSTASSVTAAGSCATTGRAAP